MTHNTSFIKNCKTTKKIDTTVHLLQFRNLMSKKQSIPKPLKDLVWDTYVGKQYGTGKCRCCWIAEIDSKSFECGHVKSEATGGKLTVSNLRPICGKCNRSMGKMHFFKFQRLCGFSDQYTINLFNVLLYMVLLFLMVAAFMYWYDNYMYQSYYQMFMSYIPFTRKSSKWFRLW